MTKQEMKWPAFFPPFDTHPSSTFARPTAASTAVTLGEAVERHHASSSSRRTHCLTVRHGHNCMHYAGTRISRSRPPSAILSWLPVVRYSKTVATVTNFQLLVLRSYHNASCASWRGSWPGFIASRTNSRIPQTIGPRATARPFPVLSCTLYLQSCRTTTSDEIRAGPRKIDLRPA
jgi:hypothetical protein